MMRISIFETILNRRYGNPIVSLKDQLVEKSWYATKSGLSSVLYLRRESFVEAVFRYGSIHEIYGEIIAGFLLGTYLKVSSLFSHQIYGLYTIEDLARQPEVQQALHIDQDIVYFMDASNVWYYGCKAGELFVYDAETAELDSLGPVEQAMEHLFDEWEAAHSDAK